jgi:(4-(4-[2-(gamma-L-glutamylamino)ethyl]phenoxymethyl)furan-2-yl)methanamine synthase
MREIHKSAYFHYPTAVARTIGLDIGGANLKAAHAGGVAQLRPYPLWKDPGGLAAALADLIAGLPPADQLAVTMTGELCDCFETKRDGVAKILDAVEQVAGDRRIRVWQTTGTFVEPTAARELPLQTAAANWLALGTFAGRYAARGAGLVLDIGSTTTDVVPLRNGQPVPQGRTDPERLRSRELAYTGVQRTPLCALLGADGAAEFFATTLDVYVTLGLLPEDPSINDTADGRPATKCYSMDRLARMLCGDRETCSEQQIVTLAHDLYGRQLRLVRRAVEEVCARSAERLSTVVIAGSGEFLARRAVQLEPALKAAIVALSDVLGPALSSAACAYSVAVLAAEEEHHD